MELFIVIFDNNQASVWRTNDLFCVEFAYTQLGRMPAGTTPPHISMRFYL